MQKLFNSRRRSEKRASKLKTKVLKTAERIFNAMCTQKENKICSIYPPNTEKKECMCVDVSSCEWSEKDGDNANFA